MKYLLTILFFLTAYFVNAQYIPNSGAYQWKGGKFVNSLQSPTGIGLPLTFTNAPDSNYAALYYNKEDTSFYQFNPVPKTWTKLQSNGGLTVSIDSIFITSIDSIFITNTDSIFIVSGNDTIFIGTGNPAMDTAYQRGDSLFGVKSGVEFLIGLSGAAAPSGGMDTAYSRGDSIFGKKNNAEFLIAEVQQAIDSIFITNTDSIFIISGNDTIFIGNSNINWEQTLQNQGLTPFVTDNTVDFGGHTFEWTNLDAFEASNATEQSFIAYNSNATSLSKGNGTVLSQISAFNDSVLLYSNNTVSALTKVIVKPRYVEFHSRGEDGGGGFDTSTIFKVRVDSSDADANNVAWFDANNVLHRGRVNGAGGIDSIFITNTDSIFVITGNDTIFIGIASNGVPVFNTIADLEAQSFDTISFARVLGFYAPNDGGEGDFYRLPGSTATPVTGMILQHGSENGRMQRIAFGWYNLKWFGAKGIGIAGYKADSAARQEAFDYIKSKGYGSLYVPGSDSPYCWAGIGLVSPNNFNFYGDGRDKTKWLNINMNFQPNYYNGTFMFFGTFATFPAANMSRVPRYQMLNGNKGDTWIRLRNISDASNFVVGDIIKPSGRAYNKDNVTGKTIWRDNAFAQVTRISDDSLILDHGLSMDIRADDHAYALYEVTNGITTASDTGSAVVFRPNSGTTTNGNLGTDQEGYNISVHDMSFDVSPYDFITNSLYDTTIGTPGNIFTLGSVYGLNLYNLRLNAFGNLGGQYYADFMWRNIDVQSARKVFDFGNESSEGLVDDIRYRYKNEFSDTTNVAMIFMNNNSHHIKIKNLSVTGSYVGNNVIQLQGGIHDVDFSKIDMNIPDFGNSGSDIIRITTEDTVQGTYPENITFDNINIATGNVRRYLSYIGIQHTDFNYTGDVIFRDLTFRGTAANNSPLFFDNADSIYAVNILTKDQDTIRIANTTYLRNLFPATGSVPPTDTFHLQPHTPGYGILGNVYNGLSPETWALDTSVLNTQIFSDSNNIQFFVDTISASPPAGAISGAKVLVAHTGATGAFATHEDQVATLVGATWTFEIADAGDNLIVNNTTQPTSFYKFDGLLWNLQRRAASIGGDAIGANYDLGTTDNQFLRFITRGSVRERISPVGDHYFNKLVGTKENNFLKVDSATGKLLTDSFVIQKVKFPIGLNTDTIYHRASGVTAGSYTNTNLTVDSMGHITAAANGSSGGGGTAFPLTMNNGGAGDASGTTFDGSVSRTLSYNTVGAVGTAKYIIRETPGGTINGVNATFTLANTPVTGTEQIFLNGVLQIVGTDYTISGATITALFIPATGDFYRANYISQ